MLSTLMLIYLVRSASADAETVIMPRCSDSPGTRMTFTPVEGFVGRYTADFCTERNYTYKEWELKVSFYETRDYCNTSYPEHRKLRAGVAHSSNVEWISSKHNCTDNQTVCMSAQFDLIFSACYSIMSSFKDRSARPTYFYFNVINPYDEKNFHKNVATVDVMDHIDYMSVSWHPGVPPSVYKVELCNEPDTNSCESVPDCVTTDKSTIKCTLNPESGCYKMYLWHIAPWIQGIFYKHSSMPYHFCRNDTSAAVPTVSGSVWRYWMWLAVGICAILALAIVCARVACSSIATTKKQKEVLRRWLVYRNEEIPIEAVQPPALRKHILLLYARECAAATRAVAALKVALQHVVDGQVYDIFSAEVMALSAGAPAEWVRAMLLRGDVCVVLLQSPALHCLYTTVTVDSESGLKLMSPLLGRRVVPRVPQFGDALLQFALRITTENVQTRDNYNKYYIATISDLPTELVPCTVPYRRYPLPAAVGLLLRDVSVPGAAPAPTAIVDDFTRHLKEFVEYARDNPDYLMDELMLVDAQ